ncbi:MAG: elongation factor G [Saprospiraceae bacterium]|jgi:elongation factor G|nr:MAG: small GTP-binding protein [Candidatus Parvibacillus calidus]MBX2937485.1 elongation factor G [Saprospiraceae bacterium]MBX7178024.1 elongation factor G [Saprospiraceae bacterium]MCB0590881.1 elongation factor G [Saprospiraceae bacterium]MCC7149484.1 elongation factor G [Saprospiraceae bacterium]
MSNNPKNIRNIVLLGHSGSGKTTLVENMLFEAKKINRIGSVDDNSTTSDYIEIEKERHSSVYSSLMHVNWKDSKINIIDTPGSDDLVGESISSMKVADTAVMLINAKYGVEVGTELIWEYIEKFHLPSVFAVNHLDNSQADFERALAQARERFGSKVVEVQYPLDAGEGFSSIVDALRMVMYKFPSNGGKPSKEKIPDAEMERAKSMHNTLVELAAENEEGLMERYFEEGTLSEEDLAKGLTIALANQQFFPVFCICSAKNMGSGRLMGFLNDIGPSPADRPAARLESGETLACDPSKETTLFIYKTISEANVGNVSYFKVYSGTLHTSDELINADNDTAERFNHIFVTNGKTRTEVEQLTAGDLGVTVKLKNSHTNNTLNTKGINRKIEPIHFPEPRHRTAIVPPDKNSLEKVARALSIVHEEDPTLVVEQSVELKQTILHGQGQLHLDIVKSRIEKTFGVKIEFDTPRIPYRETIRSGVDEVYRHKKQSGGAGQFAEVHMRIEPYYDGMPAPAGLTVRSEDHEKLPWGGTLSYLWCIVGGTIDARFSNAIKKGVLMKMEEGPLTGSRCRDIRVAVFDGKMHPVDSNDMAFQIASTMAFKNAFKRANPKVLEPIYNLEVLVPEEMVGEVMGDLQTRRAIITGMDSENHYQKISARVPLAELHGYSSTLRSLTQGRAKFKNSFADYSETPPDVQKSLIDAHDDKDEGD